MDSTKPEFCVTRNIVHFQLYYYYFQLFLLRSSLSQCLAKRTESCVSPSQQRSSTVIIHSLVCAAETRRGRWENKQQSEWGRKNKKRIGHQRRCSLVNLLQLNSTLTSLQSLLTAYTVNWAVRLMLHESSALGFVNRAAVSAVLELGSSRLLCPCLYSGLLRTQTSEASAGHIHPHLARWDSLRGSDRLESPLTFSYFHWFLCWCQSLKWIWHLQFFYLSIIETKLKGKSVLSTVLSCSAQCKINLLCNGMSFSSRPTPEQESIFCCFQLPSFPRSVP